ncbi:MAG: type II secretion system F family protein [Spirochaetales bacterium]|jgi:tight adherence protein C|nr:type II secretion system F family protein [Spirochaetales bacterium]
MSTLPLILIFTGFAGAGAGAIFSFRLKNRLAYARQKKRILAILNPTQHKQAEQQAKNSLAIPATLGLAMAPSPGKELTRIMNLLSQAGLREENHTGYYYFIKYNLIALSLIYAIYLWSTGEIQPQMIPLIGIIFIFLPEYGLKYMAMRRLQKITMALPDFIDLCNISMSAGLSWLVSVKRVVEELKAIHPEICMEFEFVFDQIQTGMNRTEAFSQLGKRNPTNEMQYLINVLIQNERMGSSILNSLSDFSKRVYTMREQQMEEKAGKLSAKMALVIMPFFLVPYVMILVGEQMVNLVRMLNS